MRQQGPTSERRAEIRRAYDNGEAMAAKYRGDLNECVRREDVITWDDAVDKSWEAGFFGRPRLVWCEGWRYGDAPEAGKSYNYRDSRPEPGVSMMAVVTEDGEELGTRDGVSAVFCAAGRSVVRYAGWLVGYGSDGEPCLLK